MCIHIYTHIYEKISVIKKNKILPSAATRMDVEGIMLSEITHTEKGRYYMISVIHDITYI